MVALEVAVREAFVQVGVPCDALAQRRRVRTETHASCQTVCVIRVSYSLCCSIWCDVRAKNVLVAMNCEVLSLRGLLHRIVVEWARRVTTLNLLLFRYGEYAVAVRRRRCLLVCECSIFEPTGVCVFGKDGPAARAPLCLALIHAVRDILARRCGDRRRIGIVHWPEVPS